MTDDLTRRVEEAVYAADPITHPHSDLPEHPQYLDLEGARGGRGR